MKFLGCGATRRIKALGLLLLSLGYSVFSIGDVLAANANATPPVVDTPPPQVLIEARIVNINALYEEELGVRFGVSKSQSLSSMPLDGRLNLTVSSASLFNHARPGTVSLALAKLGQVFLDLELSALEGERHAQVISKPHIVTFSQQKAFIQTGEESVEIVPQIVSNNKVMLQLRAVQGSHGENIPIAKSNVLLNDNETIVIGGVYQMSHHQVAARIPFSHGRQERLIFITPKIITDSSKLVRTASASNALGSNYTKIEN